MKNILKGITCLAVILCFAGPVHAQEEVIGPEGGDFSLAPFISFFAMDTGGDSTTYSLTLGTSLEYYFFRQFSLGVNVNGTVGGGGGDSDFGDTVSISLFPFLTYYFQYGATQRVAPYIGFGGGGQYFKAEGSDSQFNAEVDFFGGLDIYITASTSLYMELRDFLVFAENDNINNIMLLLGLKVVF